MKLQNRDNGRTLSFKDEEWKLIEEPVPDCVRELNNKLTDKMLACVNEYLPKKLPKGTVVKYYEMTKPEIEKTLVWLNGKFEDPFVTVPAVNALLRILGYVDLFVYDDDNGQVYHFNMIEERNKYESDKQMASR